MQVPQPLQSLFSHFPLYTYPPILPASKKTLKSPTIWVAPSSDPDSPLLSGDVECLKWQSYLALRGLNNIHVRTDIDSQGAIDARLPNLHVPFEEGKEKEKKAESTGPLDDSTNLLAAHHIPGWVDEKLGHNALEDPLEGYKDETAKDESRAWVSLLEGNIHAALDLSLPTTTTTTINLSKILTPPPPPLTGVTGLLALAFPPYGLRIHKPAIHARYRDAITALSERLGTDKWFLGSDTPTPLDALVFAYLHCILLSPDTQLRTEVTKRVNLVAWEWKVRGMVRAAFVKAS
ncbi:hypothetical protein VNI00_003119 [Paramarasmius palmivorus]|uniref:Metaxin glutathione S-transferase domain-containing protein n=1 Tax=Paramarasmius palmivorus TaxID=297713 RepID=A0AAW0DQ44_9AGAR